MICWTKTRMGWMEGATLELSGAGGAPIALTPVQPILTDEEKARIGWKRRGSSCGRVRCPICRRILSQKS